MPTFLHNRRIRPCMHALQKSRVTWLRLAKKKNLWSSQKALESPQKWIKVIQYSAQGRLVNRKRKRNFVWDVLEGHLWSPNQKLLSLKACFGMSLIFNYKVMSNELVIEAFKRPTDLIYKANDNRVLKECFHKGQIKTDTLSALQVSVASREKW